MEAKGIIAGATIQNSIECYNKKMISVISLSFEIEKIDLILENFKEIPQILYAAPSIWDATMKLTVVIKDNAEFQEVRQKLQRLPFIKGLSYEFFLGTRNHPENLSVFGKNFSRVENQKINNCVEIDETDKLLIEKLAMNGRMTFGKIAQELGSNIVTISRRYEHLIDNGYIRVVIRIDPRKIGYSGYAYLNIKFPKTEIDPLNALSEIPDVTQIQEMGGEFDYSIIVMLRDLEHLFITHERIRAISTGANIQSYIAPIFSPWPTFREFKSTI